MGELGRVTTEEIRDNYGLETQSSAEVSQVSAPASFPFFSITTNWGKHLLLLFLTCITNRQGTCGSIFHIPLSAEILLEWKRRLVLGERKLYMR